MTLDETDQTDESEVQATDQRKIVDNNWSRYEYARQRGHRTYCSQARKCERFYLGGGEQWDRVDRAVVEAARRPVAEINQIMPAINAAVGYQINNRLEFTFVPRGGSANEESSELMSKVCKQIMDNNKYKYLETDLFEDGLIQQRGYLDIRVSFNDSMLAEASIGPLDPLDVMPDPDAKSYDPDDWGDVTTTCWMTLDDIEQLYGTRVRLAVEAYRPSDADHGDDTQDEGRNKFGDEHTGTAGYDSWLAGTDAATPRVRVIDRQYWVYTMCKCAIFPTGDVRVVDGFSPEKLAEIVKLGAQLIDRKMKRVRWTVTTRDVVLHDAWSPFKHFTIVPYFPHFRRGKTRGLVDNAISPQETFNKATSSLLHIANSVANSGWIYEEDSITNLSEEQMREQGAQTGLTLVIKKSTPKDKWPAKIQPTPVPAGLDRIIEHSRVNMQSVTIPDAMLGEDEGDMSGIAIQSRQFAAQMKLSRPLDNLARTRNMVAVRLVDIIQTFYDDNRVMQIRQIDKRTGKEYDEAFEINKLDEATGQVLNNLTLGEYGVVIAEVPIAITYENGQFQQALGMKEKGVNIPDSYVVKYSSLTDKADIIDAMDNAKPDSNPLDEAKVKLLQAQAEKTQAETVVKNVEGIFSATEAAQNIASLPQVAPLGDDILGSAGYIDKDGPPLVPPIPDLGIAGAGPVPPPAVNTNPLTPINPTRDMPSPVEGVAAGIEGGM